MNPKPRSRPRNGGIPLNRPPPRGRGAGSPRDTQRLTTERILLILLALTTTVAAIELVRREVIAYRTVGHWWRIDAEAAGALFATLGAVSLWVLALRGDAPAGGLSALGLWIAVLLVFLLVPDSRE